MYLDVSPLQEASYTGIAAVTARLCRELLGDDTVDPGFFFGRYEIPPRVLEPVLGGGLGGLLRWAAGSYRFGAPVRAASADGRVFGLHANTKLARRVFPLEGSIVHDLTTVVCPEHHTAETNAYHNRRWLGDLMSDDITFAASHSTASDIRTYFPEAADHPIVVTHWGVDWSHIDEQAGGIEGPVEPYILVLGTLEPRKNAGVVLDLIAKRPEIARMFRIVFGGREGWGASLQDALESRGLASLRDSGRIVQTGFVSEAAKYVLLRRAAAVIYPSVYEGFGLPAAEAISLGVPVVVSAASSLPEVGRDFAHYFNGVDADSLHAALSAAVQRGRVEVSRSGETLAAWRERFSWPRCYRLIRDSFQALPSQPRHQPARQLKLASA